MPEGETTTNAGAKPKRTANTAKQGSGDYLTAEMIPARGKEYRVQDTSWEENYAKDALIPCLHLADGGDDDILFKITTKGNNAAIDAAGAGGEDLGPMIGTTVYLQVNTITDRSGTSKKSIQIAEVLREGNAIWSATKA